MPPRPAADGIAKLDAAARRRLGEAAIDLPVIRIFPGGELDLAFGRSNVIHAALLAGPASANALTRVRALAEFLGGDMGAGGAMRFGQRGSERVCGDARERMTETSNTGDKTIQRPAAAKAARAEAARRRARHRAPELLAWPHQHGAGRAQEAPHRAARRDQGRAAGAAARARAARAGQPSLPRRARSARRAAARRARAPGWCSASSPTDEIDARARALADAKVHEAEERRVAEEQATRRARRGRPRSRASARRPSAARSRRRPAARPRRRSARAPRTPPAGVCGEEKKPERRGRARAAASRPLKEGEAEDERSRRLRGKVEGRPSRRAEAGQARRGAPPRQADPGQCARRLRARPLARLDPPPPRARPRPRPRAGPAREDHARGGHSRDDHRPGTRQPHGRARRRRDQAADEAGPAGQGRPT